MQIALIVLCVAVYAVAWLRVQPLIAARQQLLQEIRTQQQQRDELLKQIAALQEQKNSLNESVTALVEKINSLQGTGRQVQELKSEAVKAWEKYPPKQAWSTRKEILGNRAKGSIRSIAIGRRIAATRRRQVRRRPLPVAWCQISTAAWQPSAKGYMDSWFQPDRTSPLPPPFPQDFPGQQSAVTTSPRP